MALSVGIDHSRQNWKTCILENEQTLELCSFVDSASVLAYVERTCAFYPELTIALSLGLDAPFTPLSTITDQQLDEITKNSITGRQESETREFLIAIRAINLNSYILPSVKYLPGIPIHRKLLRANLGTSNEVCAVAALLYRLREREAAWPEMRFLFVEVDPHYASVLVLEDGFVINGIGNIRGKSTHVATVELNGHIQQAFWEGLTQELAGLMAIHHIEDIVVMGEYRNAFNERFADTYQVYLFPYTETDKQGFEAALGAAVIADGLYCPGLAGEVVERLQIREASELPLTSLVE
jgi:predicted butyrate kinase (DUF1464 family)